MRNVLGASLILCLAAALSGAQPGRTPVRPFGHERGQVDTARQIMREVARAATQLYQVAPGTWRVDGLQCGSPARACGQMDRATRMRCTERFSPDSARSP